MTDHRGASALKTSSPDGEDAVYARYRETVPGAAAHWNDTIEGLVGHRSVRAYSDRPLAPGLLETLVAAAQSAPSSSNIQAWSVVAVQEPAKKARLAHLAGDQHHIDIAPLLLIFVADLARAGALAKRWDATFEGADYTEAFLLATIDAALAAQNAVVAAESLGLGTVYIGALRNHPEAIAAELGLPERSYAVFGLVVGHPDPKRPAAVKPRLPQQAVLHREVYSADAQHEPIARHDNHLLAFRKEQGLTPQTWSELVVDRMRSVDALKGRHVLRAVLNRLGFALR